MRRMELDDLYRIPFVSDAQLSPDGASVAFVVTRADREKDANRSQIWLVPADGSGAPRQLTFGDSDGAPRWSPDGKWLAFVAARGEGAKARIWLLPTGGGEARALTPADRGAGAAVWSPDASRIAFVSAVSGDDDSDGNDDSPAARNRPVVVTTVQYKSDGAGLLGEKRMHLFVCDLEGSTEQLTSGDYSVAMPAWSPDGSQLAFASAMHENRNLDLASHIFVIDARAGSEPKAVTSGITVAAAPAFSPDGRSIVYAGAPHTGVGHTRLFVVGDGEPVELAAVLDRNVMVGGPAYPGAPPRFLPDGKSVLFCARDLGCTHLYRTAIDNSGTVTKLVGDEWSSVSGLSVSADGSTIAYVQTTPSTCSEVWVAAADGSNARALTNLVGEALGDIDLFRPAARQFTAPDGTAVSGWLLHDDSAAGPKRLLLDIHGGPHNAWNPTFDGLHLYHQVLAAAGWAVLFINPRGSDGYGEAFYTGLVGDGWGRADADDFLAAVDAVVADGIADPSQVAVTGYSYGGYMTCWLTATTDRFRSAVAGGVVADLPSFAGTSDIGVGFARTELGVMPWENPDQLAASSPQAMVGGVTTPTLIVHGERDDRCPIGQAEQWFSALRARGIETELVRYPGASHLFILNGPPSQRIDWCRRIVEWISR